jgi:tetratricopeptide (TPR) repeat protein
MQEIAVGIRIDPDEGLSFTGIEAVNGLINCGGKVTSIEPGGAVMRKLGEDGEQVRLTLSGCDLKVIVDDTGFDSSPAKREHDRLYRTGSELIQPYMRLDGSLPKPANSDRARDEIQRGIEFLRQSLAILPSNWPAWWLIGKAYQAMDVRFEACEAFGKAYALHKGNADVAREYMYECLHAGRVAKAIAAARCAVKLKPDNAGLHANLALSLLVGAQLAEASTAIEWSLRLDPTDAISRNLHQRIADVQAGRRPQPKSLAELDASS